MISAQEAVWQMENIFQVPHAKAKAIARKLIDDEVLPKSSGSRIALLNTDQFVKLIFACICSQKINDATKFAETYFNLKLKYVKRRDGEDQLDISSGEFFSYIFRCHLSHQKKGGPYGDWIKFGHINVCTSEEEVVFIDAWPSTSEDGVRDKRITFGSTEQSDEGAVKHRPRSFVNIPTALLDLCAERWISAGQTPESLIDDINKSDTSKAGMNVWTFTARLGADGELRTVTSEARHASDSGFLREIDYLMTPIARMGEARKGKKHRTYPKIPPRKL
ncbi:hypothetical protein FBY14_104228 [Azospirillum brasilense]|nr:hypothetical protein FBY14_104228 [Azospirillum brasilense]